MKDLEFNSSLITNNSTFKDYLFRIKKIANARFKWINVPDSWDTDFLENILYYYGQCGVHWDKRFGTVISRVTMSGGFNIYDLPTKLECYSNAPGATRKTKYVYTGLQDTQIKDKSGVVLIKNNPDRVPTFSTIQLFAYRLFNLERAADVNLALQRTPGIIECDHKQRLTLLNLYMQYDGNQPFIFADKNLLGENALKVIDTEAPYLIDKFQAQKQAIWAEILTFLGINNVNYEKKERLIESETNANNEVTQLNQQGEYTCRKKACQQINKYFELNIDVEFNENVMQAINNNVDNISKNVESGEKINE